MQKAKETLTTETRRAQISTECDYSKYIISVKIYVLCVFVVNNSLFIEYA